MAYNKSYDSKKNQFIRLGISTARIVFWPAFKLHTGLKNWSEEAVGRTYPSWFDEESIAAGKASHQRQEAAQVNYSLMLDRVASFKSGQVFTNYDSNGPKEGQLAITALVMGNTIYAIEEIEKMAKNIWPAHHSKDSKYKIHILKGILGQKEVLRAKLLKPVKEYCSDRHLFNIMQGLDVLERVKESHTKMVGGMAFNCENDIAIFNTALKKLNENNCTGVSTDMIREGFSDGRSLKDLLIAVEIQIEKESLSNAIRAVSPDKDETPKEKFKL